MFRDAPPIETGSYLGKIICISLFVPVIRSSGEIVAEERRGDGYHTTAGVRPAHGPWATLSCEETVGRF